MTVDKNVLLARFRLNPESLRDYTIAVLNFPYAEALSEFESAIKRIRGDEYLPQKEYPPYRQLNDVMVASIPMLIHAFERKAPWLYDRRTMIFSGIGNHNISRPTIQEIKGIVREWALQWANNIFADELQKSSGKDALNNLLERIEVSPEDSWHEYNALGLWNDRASTDRVAWDAIPSVLAAMLVAGQKEITLTDLDDRSRSFRWQLTQDEGKHLAVVSPYQSADYLKNEKERTGTYAYRLGFGIQTQGGDAENPWIYLYVSIRRYIDSCITSVRDPRRDVSIMMQLGSARMDDWPLDANFEPTLVKLPVSGTAKKPKWSSNVPDLLATLQMRPLANPEKIYQEPKSFFKPDPTTGDTYYVVYSEGMRPSHTLKSGIGLRERGEIVDWVLKKMKGTLEEDIAQPIDQSSVLRVTDIRNRRDDNAQLRLLAMFTQDDLKDIAVIRRAGDLENSNRRLQLTTEGLRRATGGRSLRVIILHQTSDSRRPLEKYVRETLFLNEGIALPDGIEIISIPIYSDLGTAPTIPDRPTWNSSSKERKRVEDQWNKDVRAAYDGKVKDWQEFLSQHKCHDGYTLALIEMSGGREITFQDELMKSALRRACVSQGVSSQMIFAVTEQALDTTKPSGREQVSRIKRAANDLLLRQTHLMYGPPAQIYGYAGLSDDISKNLVVVGLYRHRTYGTPSLDYPIAVALLPDGRVEVFLPSEDGLPHSPVNYLEAGLRIGNAFRSYRNTKDKTVINLTGTQADGRKDYSRLTAFAVAIMTANFYHDRPVLALIEADGWRANAIPSLTDPKLTKDILDLSVGGTHTQKFAPVDLPCLRAIRIRDAGNLGETPQYVATSSHKWEDIEDADDLEYMFGVSDVSTKSSMSHFYSIGRRPLSVKKPGNEAYMFSEGADIAHRHQQAVEFVPFFLQPEDDPLSWCRVAHFLRSSPAWNGGNIILSYPLHLAKTLIVDQVDVFRPSA